MTTKPKCLSGCGDEYMLGCCEVHDKPKQGSEEPITDHALECWHGIYTMSRNEAKWFNEACYARITALRAELAAADQNLKTMLQTTGEEAERQLATAREEIAVRDASISDYARQMADIREHWHAEATENVTLKADLAAEKARADRAEERVKELEVEVERRKTFNKTGFSLLKEKCKQLHSVTYCQDERCNLGLHHHAVERKEHPPDGVSYSGLIHYGSEIGCAECAILAARARKEGGSR